MRLGRHATFRRRVAIGSGVAVAVAVALASGVVYLLVRGQLRGQVDDALRTRLEQIRTPRGVTYNGFQLVIEPPELQGESPGYVQFVASDGSVLRPPDESGSHMNPTAGSLAVASGGSSSSRLELAFSVARISSSVWSAAVLALGGGCAWMRSKAFRSGPTPSRSRWPCRWHARWATSTPPCPG